MQNSPHRIAFYPCCADDISQSRHLLTGLVDEIIYCDLRTPRSWSREARAGGAPIIRFVQDDVKHFIPQLPRINILFYRRDSSGEGGSGLYLLGKTWLEEILKHFSLEGGAIITDGSNSRSGMFRKMTRSDGYARASWGWRFRPASEQRWLESHGLYTIDVTRTAKQIAGADAENRPAQR